MNQIDNLPYTPISKISSDRSSVLLVQDKSTPQKFILKRFPDHLAGKYLFESEKLIQNLSHPFVIKMKEVHDNLQCVLMEYAPFGDFCHLLMGGTVLPEKVARTYFRQLVEGIDYLHKNGVAHLDLKLDNLLLGANKSLKIIDFDLSQRIEEESRSYARSKGTTNYRAPEVRSRKCANFKAADIYSIGVILFSLVTGLPPYSESVKGEVDGWYNLMMKSPENYWEKISKYCTVKMSDDFKELFFGMVSEHPEKRMKVEDIRKNRWFNGETLSEEELRMEMEKIPHPNL